jgi:hypothetical protein
MPTNEPWLPSTQLLKKPSPVRWKRVGVKVRDGRIATLNATNGKLQQRIAALASSGGSAEDSPSAASHLRNRLEALGPLVGELDSFAGEVSKYADALRDELMLCRQYAQAINDQKSF